MSLHIQISMTVQNFQQILYSGVTDVHLDILLVCFEGSMIWSQVSNMQPKELYQHAMPPTQDILPTCYAT